MGLQRGLDVGELGRGGELVVGFVRVSGTGEQEAERDVRRGEEWIGVNRLAVAGLGGWRLWVGSGGVGGGGRFEGFEGESEVVEDLRIVGELGVEGGEDLECCGQVSGCEGVVGLLDEGGFGGGLGVGMGEVLCAKSCGAEKGKKDRGQQSSEVATEWRCGVSRDDFDGWRGSPLFLLVAHDAGNNAKNGPLIWTLLEVK